MAESKIYDYMNQLHPVVYFGKEKPTMGLNFMLFAFQSMQ